MVSSKSKSPSGSSTVSGLREAGGEGGQHPWQDGDGGRDTYFWVYMLKWGWEQTAGEGAWSM